MIGEKNLRIIVIRKDIYQWLTSIRRWAEKCNWEKKDKMDYIDDYIHFYKKWESFKSSKILFVDYISLLKNNRETINDIEKFTGKKCLNVKVANKLKCSDEFNLSKMKYYTEKKYMEEFTEEELSIIREKLDQSSFSPNQ